MKYSNMPQLYLYQLFATNLLLVNLSLSIDAVFIYKTATCNQNFKYHCTKKFSIKDFSGKCDQIRKKLQIWSHLLDKFLIENS